MSKAAKKKNTAAEGAVEVVEDSAEEVGQLYTDLLRYMQDGNTGQQMVFTPDVMEAGLSKAEMEDKIIAHIKELVGKKEVDMAREFGLDIIPDNNNLTDIEDWIEMRKSLFKALDGANGDKFVKIYEYKNILKVDP